MAVYFAKAGDKVKIGHSLNPEKRIKDLQVGQVEKIELVLVVSGGRKRERQIHKDLSGHHVSGEWFFHNAEVMDYMNALAESKDVVQEDKIVRTIKTRSGMSLKDYLQEQGYCDELPTREVEQSNVVYRVSSMPTFSSGMFALFGIGLFFASLFFMRGLNTDSFPGLLSIIILIISGVFGLSIFFVSSIIR